MSESDGLTEPFTTEVDLPAPVEEVFRHLTDPAAMVRWMGQHANLEPVAGGAFEVDINGVPVRGHYLEIDPPRRVLVSWGVTGNADLPPGATQVEFTLTGTAAGTRLRVVHRGLPPQQASVHATGWQHFLDRLTRAAAGVDPGPDPWARTEDHDEADLVMPAFPPATGSQMTQEAASRQDDARLLENLADQELGSSPGISQSPSAHAALAGGAHILTDMLRTDTPWGPRKPASPAEVAQIFNSSQVWWWIAGGYAIELTAGRPMSTLISTCCCCGQTSS